ncbi:MAG: hypothetical protein QM758_28200 [Armatimonas sp.]
MKYLFSVIGLMALVSLVTGCSGTLGSGVSRLLVTRGTDDNQDIYLLSSTGATLQQLTSDAESEESPRWSPDGLNIAFIRRNALAGSQALYLMNADGSGQQNFYPGVLTVADVPFAPAWLSSDTLVFRRGTSAPTSLVKRSVNGGDVTTLTSPGTDVDDLPAVSPDGATIAFIRTSGSSTAVTNFLYLANADGTNARSIATGVARSTPAWSPDGTKLAFVHAKDGNLELYVAAADGSDPLRITNNAAADFAPVWSPDSTKIVFASDRDGNNELYRINADGTSPLRLTNNTVSDIPYGWR